MKRANVWIVHLQLNRDVEDTQEDTLNKANLVHNFSYYVYFFSLHQRFSNCGPRVLPLWSF